MGGTYINYYVNIIGKQYLYMFPTHMSVHTCVGGECVSIVKNYMEAGGGNWAKVSNVAAGATVTIGSVYLDDESFEDKSYVVVNGIYDPSGEEVKVRLGVQNLKRIVEALGDNEATWVNSKLTVLGFQDYPGLGSRGILWGAIKMV